MTRTYCDKCDKELKEYQEHNTLNLNGMAAGGRKVKWWALCDDCTQLLVNFLEVHP